MTKRKVVERLVKEVRAEYGNTRLVALAEYVLDPDEKSMPFTCPLCDKEFAWPEGCVARHAEEVVCYHCGFRLREPREPERPEAQPTPCAGCGTKIGVVHGVCYECWDRVAAQPTRLTADYIERKGNIYLWETGMLRSIGKANTDETAHCYVQPGDDTAQDSGATTSFDSSKSLERSIKEHGATWQAIADADGDYILLLESKLASIRHTALCDPDSEVNQHAEDLIEDALDAKDVKEIPTVAESGEGRTGRRGDAAPLRDIGIPPANGSTDGGELEEEAVEMVASNKEARKESLNNSTTHASPADAAPDGDAARVHKSFVILGKIHDALGDALIELCRGSDESWGDWRDTAKEDGK